MKAGHQQADALGADGAHAPAAARADALGAIELIEEAVHLLRSAPAGVFAIYYAGSAPFILGLLFFWAHTTWFTPPAAAVAWAALGLVVLFAAMKVAHAEFCARLLARRLGAEPPAWSWARLRRIAATQLRLQAWGLFVLPLALFLIVPFGWPYAYFQSVNVFSDDDDAHRAALAQATLWPGQNYLGLLLLALVALCAWINLAMAFYAVPWLAHTLLGIENLFGFSGWWFLNTTFLASITGLAWLAVDPLVKAFYTLRVFHGRARRTGEDVRVDFRLARRARGSLRAAVALVLLAASVAPRIRADGAVVPVVAVAPSSKGRSVDPAQLNRAIDTVLARPEFQWRLRPPPRPEESEEQDGPFKRFIRVGLEMIREFFQWIGRVLGRVIEWISSLFPHGDARTETGGAVSAGLGLLRVLLYVFVAAAVVLLAVLIYLVWKRSRALATTVLAARAALPATPDLHDENTQAAQLPAEGWLALAREQLARGEWRLAWRALYLATLAQLAADGLLSLAKFKTNLDYERELRRRALTRREIVARFAARRDGFEAVWYGRAQPAEAEARGWLAELERPAPP
jgi:hypothetical protein